MVCNQRGMALISVILIMAVLLTLAHTLAEKIWHSSQKTIAADRWEQLYWAAQAGIENARQELASSYADSRGWQNYLVSGTSWAYPETPTWTCSVNGISVEIFLRDNHDGDDDSNIDNDLRIFVLARAGGQEGCEAIVESLCGFERPIATRATGSQPAESDMFVDLSTQPVSSYEMVD